MVRRGHRAGLVCGRIWRACRLRRVGPTGMPTRESRPTSDQNIFDHFAVDVGEAAVDAGLAEG
jgi:hypothetical protein